MNLAVSVQSDWDYLRVCFSDWPFWAIIYFLLNCAFKLKHPFKKTPSIPWDSEEFSQVIWPKQSFNFTFNFAENSLESERYSKVRSHSSSLWAHLESPKKKLKPRDFKTHATYFNPLSPVSEPSDYRICRLLIQGFLFGKFVQVRGSHGNAYYAGKYSINCSLVLIVLM